MPYQVDVITGCWEWEGRLSEKGYGVIKIGKQKRHAHRVMWLLARGELTSGIELHHRCRNRRCINPEHLQAVSKEEHLELHMGTPWGRRNRCKTHCDNGHPFDERNTYRRPNGNRGCQRCNAERQKEWRRRNGITERTAEIRQGAARKAALARWRKKGVDVTLRITES